MNAANELAARSVPDTFDGLGEPIGTALVGVAISFSSGFGVTGDVGGVVCTLAGVGVGAYRHLQHPLQ